MVIKIQIAWLQTHCLQVRLSKYCCTLLIHIGDLLLGVQIHVYVYHTLVHC